MTIPYGPTPEQVGDLLIPDGGITAATPKLLLIHGGGFLLRFADVFAGHERHVYRIKDSKAR